MLDYRLIAEKAAAKLEGTQSSLEQVLEDLDAEGADEIDEFCDRFDSLVFCCTQCDWWFNTSETGNDVYGQWACEECGGQIDG